MALSKGPALSEVEGMNRTLRAIIDRAFGYRNFENFRLQVLAEHGAPSG
jgi:transposase